MFHDECGVFAALDVSGRRMDASRLAWYGLFALQHRGQDSAGIAVNNSGTIMCQRSQGLLVEGFDEVVLNMMQGHAAIGHVRYPSQGDPGIENAQPMLIKYRAGQMALAMNGSLNNSEELRLDLQEKGAIFQTSSDAEVMLSLLARNRIVTDNIEDSVKMMIDSIRGAYSVVMMTPGKVLGFRDPNGIRPLCLGRLDDIYILASESCAIDSVGGEFIRDVKPGELISISASGINSIMTVSPEDMKPGPNAGKLCLFEFVYFARPDSTIDGSNVYAARDKAGRLLARQAPCEADLVIGAPDSGLAAAIGYAAEAGIPYGQGLLKNRYVGRTFIQPTQLQRELTVAMKFAALTEAVKGKRIVMIDDSIVRGTTTRHIIRLLKKAGALEVHLRIASPPVFYPCFYGVDTPSQNELSACNMNQEEIREMIDADSLAFLSLEGLKASTSGLKCGHCTGCFNGVFPAGVPHNQESVLRKINQDDFFNSNSAGADKNV
ncbi:MAG: amidophosphoribosyltransferase [Clostridiaceae bacterium]|nr:amidophosphoribosyltransferase [Clostridiaceae bacterium]